MTIFNQEDFTGGLSLLDNTKIKDNELVSSTNMFYDSDFRLKSRRGYTQWSTVPDAAISINTCEATTDWAASGDASNLTLDTTNEIRGAGALNFDMSAYSSGVGKLTYTGSSTVDISSTKGYLGLWVKFPTGYTTNLTSIRVRLGNDASNFYMWTITNPTANTNSFIKLNYADASTTGTVTDTAIDFFEVEVTTSAGYAGYTDFIIDDIRSYASTYTKPVSSLYSYKNETTGETVTICTAGTNMFLWNVAASCWEQIDSGLSEFETGSTTNRTRWSFISYKDVIYGVNGVDGYKTWNGKVISTDVAIKGKYLSYLSGIAFIAGDPDNPSTVSYTSPYPANLSAYADSIKVGADEEGSINVLFPVGNLMICFKNEKSYYLDVFGSTDVTQAIDSQNGGFSHRCAKNVGNGILYYNGIGVDTLSQKSAQIGASALESKPMTDNLRKSFIQVNPNHYNSNCGTYIKELTNFYISIDTGNDDKPETTYVYSSLLGGNSWSKYTIPTSYDFARYEDSDGTIDNLMTSASNGIIYKIENGFNDNGIAIYHEVLTKEWDFGDPALSKEYSSLTLSGLKTKGFDLKVEIRIDGEIEDLTTIGDDFTTSEAPVGTIGSEPIGDEPIAGSSEEADDSLDLYPYICRIYKHVTGRKVQVKVYSESKNANWSLDKISVGYEAMDFDEFPIQFQA